jgi:hypothetical protein
MWACVSQNIPSWCDLLNCMGSSMTETQGSSQGMNGGAKGRAKADSHLWQSHDRASWHMPASCASR